MNTSKKHHNLRFQQQTLLRTRNPGQDTTCSRVYKGKKAKINAQYKQTYSASYKLYKRNTVKITNFKDKFIK